jgi:SUN domain-containing protein 1/2
LSLEEAQHPTTNGNDSSYDYAAEEREFQQARRATHTRGRGRISTDNKAYKPSASDVDDDDDEFSDDGKGKRRRKKKRKEATGLVNTLPSLNYDKRKRKKGKGGKGNVGETGDADPGEGEESDGEGSESDGQTTDKVMYTLHISFPHSHWVCLASNPLMWLLQQLEVQSPHPHDILFRANRFLVVLSRQA